MFSVALPDSFSGTYDETVRLLTKLAEHGNGSWQPVYIDNSSGKKVAVFYESPQPHGPVETLDLATTVKQSDAKALAASLARRGLQLITFDPFQRQATAGSIWPAHDAIRRAIADGINCDPWEIGITVEWKEARIESVTITGASLPVGAEQRLTLLRNVITSCVPGGTEGWKIELDMTAKSVRLIYGLPAQLPKLCQLSDLLPTTIRPDDWAELPIGVGTDNEVVTISLLLGPHTLVIGPTGSGKSAAISSLVGCSLSRGFKLAVVEVIKGGVDFMWAKPFASYWAEDLASGQQVMEKIYEEGARRKALIKKMEVSNWAELPEELRRRENVSPLLVVVDEYGSLALDEPIPKGLAKDDPYLLEAVERNSQRSIIQSIVGKIAREYRFVGIFLSIATQRPDAKLISGELRSNLTSAIQLIAPGRIPSYDTLAMVLPGDQATLAAELASRLDDGKSKGLALLAAEGGTVQGARVAFAPPKEIPELLKDIGVIPVGN